MTISVLLVDDHELIRQGLRRAFERDGDFTVSGEAGVDFMVWLSQLFR